MSELKEFTFCLGQYTENGSPCVVAVDDEENPRLASDEKFYLKSEADKVISELKEERRWRKFPDEKPSEEMEGEDFLVSNGYYSVVCEWRGYWNNDPFCGDKNCDVVMCWMPLPAAPKEA